MTTKSKLQLGRLLSLLVDIIVIFLWIGDNTGKRSGIVIWMLSLTLLHVCLSAASLIFIKFKRIPYSWSKEQKNVIVLVSLMTFLISLFSILNRDNPITLYIMLVNGILVSSYPHMIGKWCLSLLSFKHDSSSFCF